MVELTENGNWSKTWVIPEVMSSWLCLRYSYWRILMKNLREDVKSQRKG